MIKKMRYEGYFLIVWDFIHYARAQDVPVGQDEDPLRAASSVTPCASRMWIRCNTICSSSDF